MPANHVLEVRIFRVHHGRRNELLDRFRDQLLPMLKRHGVEPIHYGPSLHDDDSVFLIRAWPSVAERQEKLDAMYGGADWLMNQEQQVLDMIDTMDTCVFGADEWLIGAIQEGFEDWQDEAEKRPVEESERGGHD
jgi:hypothetical protein